MKKEIISCWTDTKMDVFHLTLRVIFTLLFVTLPVTAQTLCRAGPVQFAENNTVGDVVTTIDTLPEVTLMFEPPDIPENPFSLDGTQLIAQRVLDYEENIRVETKIKCTLGETEDILNIFVILKNINDNPPNFPQTSYNLSIDEFTPMETSVASFPAEDLDQPVELYYTLTSDSSSFFSLRSPTDPQLLVTAVLDYDRVKTVQMVLTAQDTPLTGTPDGPSFTATTTITVNIMDVDNRPPWFLPCTMHTVGGVVVCQSSGYMGRVSLNQQEVGALLLKPQQLTAVDGDSGINEEIVYSLLSGNKNNIFAVEASSGNISMLKAADVTENIILTVLAAQKNNRHQVATTSVNISVQVESLYKPRFERRSYQGRVSAVGTMALDSTTDSTPLRIIALDEDYNGTNGINPHVSYTIVGSTDFSLIDGFLFMMTSLEDGTVVLGVTATDQSNDEVDRAELIVEVKSGVTPTLAPSTTVNTVTTGTTDTSPTTTKPSVSSSSQSTTSSVTPPIHTSHPVTPTTDSTTSTQSLWTSTNPPAPDGGSSTASPKVGGYNANDMAALGVSLAVLLLLCLLIIGLLVRQLRRGDANSRKIFEASVFLSALSPGAPKEGIQFTNEAFQKDQEEGSLSSAGDTGETSQRAWEVQEEQRQAELKLSALLNPPEELQTAESEKDLKPILTKERRGEEGYKSVWFKEDIEPDAMNQVVLIPDSREEDSEEEEEDREEEKREQEKEGKNSPSHLVVDTDLDSGLGVKIEDPGEGSEREEDLNVDL